LPPYLKQGLQTYSRLAKLDSDPGKSVHPEALTTVQPGETEWLLDVLQSMLDFYFVQPARLERKKISLEQMIAPPPPPAAVEPEEVGASEATTEPQSEVQPGTPAATTESWTAK